MTRQTRAKLSRPPKGDEEALEGRIDRMLGMLQLKGLLFICIAVVSQVVWLVGLTSYSSRMIDLMPN